MDGVCTDASADRVLIAGVSFIPGWNDDIRAELARTGAFSAVDVYDIGEATPTVEELQAYDAVLVYMYGFPHDGGALGENLVSYFDGGGRVVVANWISGSTILGERWGSEGFALLDPIGMQTFTETAPLGINEPGSPLVAGVTSLRAANASLGSGGPINGGVVVATWGSGVPLILRDFKDGRARVELNMLPVSRASRDGFWVGDGADIMRNALLFE